MYRFLHNPCNLLPHFRGIVECPTLRIIMGFGSGGAERLSVTEFIVYGGFPVGCADINSEHPGHKDDEK